MEVDVTITDGYRVWEETVSVVNPSWSVSEVQGILKERNDKLTEGERPYKLLSITSPRISCVEDIVTVAKSVNFLAQNGSKVKAANMLRWSNRNRGTLNSLLCNLIKRESISESMYKLRQVMRDCDYVTNLYSGFTDMSDAEFDKLVERLKKEEM